MLVPIRYTKNVFLRGLCLVYLIAFLSFYLQIPGLYGENGILPARTQMISKSKDLISKIHNKPTLLWFAPYLGLDVEYMLDVLSITGVVLSFTGLLSQKFCLAPVFGALWSLYFSLYQVGQTFMLFQWDNLLLEAGFLSLFVAPWRYYRLRSTAITATTPSDHVSLWAIRWLLFRILFTMGTIKLSSGSPIWWNLSALSVHFETMPIPSPLAWYAHHLPQWFLRLITGLALAMDIAIPAMFLVPVRNVRLIAAFLRIVLQLHIMATGNFNFFDILIIVLCVSLLDDRIFLRLKSPPQQRRSALMKALYKLPTPVIISFVVYGLILLLGLKFQPDFTVDAKLGFTRDQLQAVLPRLISYSYILALVNLAYLIVRALSDVFAQRDGVTRLTAFGITFIVLLAELFMFGMSTVPMSSLTSVSNSTISPEIRSLHNKLSNIHLANSYSIFRQTVGSNIRKEIIIEGANHIEGPWQEYNFLYKPGNVNTSLSFAAPYQPRLDWQMHFASRGTYHQHSWIMSLAYRLLEGRREVLSLMGTNPFPVNPPKYVRGTLYTYKYTVWNSRNQNSWWTREKVGEYFPVFSRDHPPLLDYLTNMNIIIRNEDNKQKVFPPFQVALDQLRFLAGQIEGSLFVWSLLFSIMIITISRRK